MAKIDILTRQNVMELYNQGIRNAATISKKLNKTYNTICRHMNALGLKNVLQEKYTFNQNFFEQIDTEEKAYCLGLWYSDGNVYVSKDNHYRITIQMIDKDIIYKVKKCLEYSGNVTEVFSNKNKINYRLRIASPKLSKDLIDKGCVANKSLIIKFPQPKILPIELTRHFIRGIFEGDGCITKDKQNRWRIGILGTKELVEHIKNNTRFNFHIYHSSHTKKNTWLIYIYKQQDIFNFLKYIYEDTKIYMDRKQQLAKECMNDLPNRRYKKCKRHS